MNRVPYSDGMKTYRRIIAVSVFCGLMPLAAAAQMMGPPPVPMSPQQFSQAHAGQPVQIAVRVQRMRRSMLYAELLQHQTDTLSKATGKAVELYFADGTPVIMGTASEIRPGAVLFVYGIVTKPGHVDIKRAVIDTRYVRVQ
ncbi:MAG: hypothetical protein JO135_03495 [Candidatus Eremiobacteraeota bacterium]|nr:hypothetical protein [Candidatus Eremiobacteraeota bacterium]